MEQELDKETSQAVSEAEHTPDSSPTLPPVPSLPVKDDSRPPTAASDRQSASLNALNIVWSFGLSKQVGVLNMSTPQQSTVAYACAHTGVLYDFENNEQRLLSGHCNTISCMCVSEDKRWLATADKGPDSMVIIWDTQTGIPVQTLFEIHPEGVIAIAMTPNARYLAVLSASESQEMSIWDWTSDGDSPLCRTVLDSAIGMQTYLHFNPENFSQVVSNSEQQVAYSDSQVVFYEWEGDTIKACAPRLTDDDFNKPVGRYSSSIFQTKGSRALTATSLGNLVVWDNRIPGTPASADKKALKLVRLQEKGITVLTTTDRHIVTGDANGHVKFFDQTLKLLHWYQDFNLGPIASLSFSYDKDFMGVAREDTEFPPDATIAAKKFAMRNFVVSTSSAIVGFVKTNGTDIRVIQREHESAVHAITCHPSRPWLVIGSYAGLLQVWDYQTKNCLVSRQFERGNLIRCLQYDPSGTYLALGFLNGSVRVLDALTLSDEQPEPFRYSRDAISHITFSHDSQFLATADVEFVTTLFVSCGTDSSEAYSYLGRYRAHYQLVHDLVFGRQLDTDEPRLLSVGKDRMLVEYDLQNSSKDTILLTSRTRIEQSAVPQCLAWYPALSKESFIVTASDQFKFKLYNTTTKMCRHTFLGPTYGSPLQKMLVVPGAESRANGGEYLAYVTRDKIGLHILPLDGNPHNSMALIAHPGGVSDMMCSYEGKYVFTAGGPDATVHMWEITADSLQAQSRLGGEDLEPFYSLLEGGRQGDLFRQLQDYFYYAQLRSQGIDSMEQRVVSTTIPLTEVPFVMRALGFYPSEQEIEDMINEVKFRQYVETGQFVDKIDLGDFIKLFINHRPAFGLDPAKLGWAFDTLGFPGKDGTSIDRSDLLDILQSKGEHMTEYELAECLTTLLGYNPEGGSSELQEFDPTTAGDIIEATLPTAISYKQLLAEVLGFSRQEDQQVEILESS